MVVVDVEDVVVTGKFTASIYLAVVLIRFTVAPVKSLPVVTVFTFNNIAVIVPNALLTDNVGLGI